MLQHAREAHPKPFHTMDRPCDAVIMAIVDTWEVDGETRYTK